jgi:hypothetical protein
MFKYSMDGTPMDNEAIVAFKPLDEDESLDMPDTDTCRVKTAEFMRQIFQDSRDGWKTMDFLEKCKKGTPGFDFRVNGDPLVLYGSQIVCAKTGGGLAASYS